MTLQVPLAGAAWNNGSSELAGPGMFSKRAGKSFVKTKVDSYFGLVCEHERYIRIDSSPLTYDIVSLVNWVHFHWAL